MNQLTGCRQPKILGAAILTSNDSYICFVRQGLSGAKPIETLRSTILRLVSSIQWNGAVSLSFREIGAYRSYPMRYR